MLRYPLCSASARGVGKYQARNSYVNPAFCGWYRSLALRAGVCPAGRPSLRASSNSHSNVSSTFRAYRAIENPFPTTEGVQNDNLCAAALSKFLPLESNHVQKCEQSHPRRQRRERP
jgi:hypothetical protein